MPKRIPGGIWKGIFVETRELVSRWEEIYRESPKEEKISGGIPERICRRLPGKMFN